jgi:hypothetical protein
MRDCRTFAKLQEAMELSQAAKPGYTAYGVPPPSYDMGAANKGYTIQSSQSYPQSKVYIFRMIHLSQSLKRNRKVYPDK